MLAKTKQWGNSLALIIPKNVVTELRLRPNEQVAVTVTRTSDVLAELFGRYQWKTPTQKILADARKNTSKWE